MRTARRGRRMEALTGDRGFAREAGRRSTRELMKETLMSAKPVGPDMTDEDLLLRLRQIVGRANVLTGEAAAPFSQGYRFGQGPLVAAVRPAGLVEMWRVAELCVAADRIVIAQAANTGLTGGSTPDGSPSRPRPAEGEGP